MDFTVEILKHPTENDWQLCKTCTLVTVGKESSKPPTEEWKKKILKARHSPIRTLEFCFRLNGIPSWCATHLVRHVHATPFVKTQRSDRNNGHDRGADRQDTPVNMCWFVNAEELMVIANKRLCRQAAYETRQVVQAICEAVIKVNPEFTEFLVPMCYWKNGKCDEFNCCGFNQTYQGGETNAE